MNTKTPMSQQAVRVPCYLIKLSDDDLQTLLDTARERILPQAAAFGAFLVWNCECEQQRRQHNASGEGMPIEARPMSCQLELWSDTDVAEAAEITAAFSLGSHESDVAEVFDQLSVFTVQVAGERLRNSGDLRNAECYAARHERGFCR